MPTLSVDYATFCVSSTILYDTYFDVAGEGVTATESVVYRTTLCTFRLVECYCESLYQLVSVGLASTDTRELTGRRLFIM